MNGLHVGGRFSRGIDRRYGRVWGCRRVVYEPGLVIGLVHGSNAGDTEASSKVGKSVVNRENDAEAALHPLLEFLTNKGSIIRCDY